MIKYDCFAYKNKTTCRILKTLDCACCKFYKPKNLKSDCFALCQNKEKCSALKDTNCIGCLFYKKH